ncbi:MAG: hypothetical protein JNL74_20735 [Fibrobacteres bacterium]|nr:hypothetical protein [Fibrobacterota bacterium]
MKLLLTTVTLAFTLLLIISCSSRDLSLFRPSTWFPTVTDNAGPSALPLDMPENVFENLMIAYNSRVPSLYERLLDDEYRFYMSQSLTSYYNEENRSPDPATWNSEVVTENSISVVKYYTDKNKDVSVARNLFSSTGPISDISLSFDYSPLDANADTADFKISNIAMTITQRNPFVQFTVEDGPGKIPTRIILKKNPASNEWKIYRWYDNTYSSYDDLD